MLSYFARRNIGQRINQLPVLSELNGLTRLAAKGIADSVRSINGHAWTIVPYGLSTITTPPNFDGVAFEAVTDDPLRGRTPIHGTLHTSMGHKRTLVILLHGIASTPREAYMRRMVRVLNRDGFDVLSMALRGALGLGSDHYHAGLTDDLKSVLKDPRVEAYEDIFVVGFSLGGQIALRFAMDERPDRLKGVVGLCSPISMLHSQRVLDGPTMKTYRIPILMNLKRKYKSLTANGLREGNPVMAHPNDVARIKTFYEWDQTVVCPRYGYDSVEDYYADVSVGPHLSDVECSALMVFTQWDPLIPINALQDYLDAAHKNTEVHVLDQGGHLGFRSDLNLGFPGEAGLENQVSAWISQQG